MHSVDFLSTGAVHCTFDISAVIIIIIIIINILVHIMYLYYVIHVSPFGSRVLSSVDL